MQVVYCEDGTTLGRNLAWYLVVRGYFFIFITYFTLAADGSIHRYWIIGGTQGFCLLN
jgi:hypothetical protein